MADKDRGPVEEPDFTDEDLDIVDAIWGRLPAPPPRPGPDGPPPMPPGTAS